MEQWLMGGAAFLLLGFTLVGGPIFLADWLRRRGQAAIERQITLTDALDGHLGAIVTPVVKKPLLGPWEIRLAVPLLGFTTMGKILSVVDDVFADVPKTDASYRIILSTKAGSSLREARASRVPRVVRRWDGNSTTVA